MGYSPGLMHATKGQKNPKMSFDHHMWDVPNMQENVQITCIWVLLRMVSPHLSGQQSSKPRDTYCWTCDPVMALQCSPGALVTNLLFDAALVIKLAYGATQMHKPCFVSASVIKWNPPVFPWTGRHPPIETGSIVGEQLFVFDITFQSRTQSISVEV